MNEIHVPVEPFHPGEYLRDELSERGWSYEHFADVSGMSLKQVVSFASETSPVTPAAAELIGRAFGTSADVWMNLQRSYELAMANQVSKPQKEVTLHTLLRDSKRYLADVEQYLRDVAYYRKHGAGPAEDREAVADEGLPQMKDLRDHYLKFIADLESRIKAGSA